jgi:hypothetical protein
VPQWWLFYCWCHYTIWHYGFCSVMSCMYVMTLWLLFGDSVSICPDDIRCLRGRWSLQMYVIPRFSFWLIEMLRILRCGHSRPLVSGPQNNTRTYDSTEVDIIPTGSWQNILSVTNVNALDDCGGWGIAPCEPGDSVSELDVSDGHANIICIFVSKSRARHQLLN